MMWLSACGTSPEPVVTTEVVYERPPQGLMEGCEQPTPPPAPWTNADLWEYTLRLQSALAACRTDMEAIKRWAEE